MNQVPGTNGFTSDAVKTPTHFLGRLSRLKGKREGEREKERERKGEREEGRERERSSSSRGGEGGVLFAC